MRYCWHFVYTYCCWEQTFVNRSRVTRCWPDYYSPIQRFLQDVHAWGVRLHALIFFFVCSFLLESRLKEGSSDVAVTTSGHEWRSSFKIFHRTLMHTYRCTHIDYRSEDGRFPVSASWMKISNPDLLSSSETWVNPGIINWKSLYLIELDVRKPFVVSISQRSE